MAHELQGRKIAILAADGVERVELELPRGALLGAGAKTELLSIHPGEIQARQFDMVSAGTFAVDRLVTCGVTTTILTRTSVGRSILASCTSFRVMFRGASKTSASRRRRSAPRPARHFRTPPLL